MIFIAFLIISIQLILQHKCYCYTEKINCNYNKYTANQKLMLSYGLISTNDLFSLTVFDEEQNSLVVTNFFQRTLNIVVNNFGLCEEVFDPHD